MEKSAGAERRGEREAELEGERQGEGNQGENRPATAAVDPASLPVGQRVALLVRALNGARRTNEALARCGDGDAMVEVLLDASRRLGLNLSRRDLLNTPPIRDWIWWKNKEALLTIGDNRPRYQQDGGQGRSGEASAAGSAATGEPRTAEGGGIGSPPADGPGGDQPPRRRFLGLF